MCGSDVPSDASACGVCGYGIAGTPAVGNAGGLKCARCGSLVEGGFDFCPICGQNQRERAARPDTRIIQIDPEAPAQAQAPPPPVVHTMPPVMTSGGAPVPPPMLSMAPPPVGPPGGSHFGGAMPAPVAFTPAPAAPPPMPAVDPAAMGPAATGRTVVAAPAMPRPAVADDERTVPAPTRSRPSVAAVDDNAPTTSFDPREVAQMVHGSSPTGGGARRPEEDTREGTVPHGPWAGSSPSSPLVGARGQASTPTNPATSTARLVLVARDGTEGDKFAVVGERLTLGRRAADVLFPDDDFLSPTHARIERQGDHFWLVDAGSTNGVFLRVRGTAPIYPGDSFMIGHQLMRVENVDGPTEEHPPDELGTRAFGTPLQPAWGKLAVLGRGGIRGDQFGLRGARVVLGRESGDVIFPHDPFLSREHARLRLELNGSTMSVFIEDLNSANGTYIRIRGACELHNRDTFRIGDQIIRLRLD
jgi:pSer/pThr/pTyr-binding forkhead associated (FHA) protein/RNA polymerase subunit RPABC4/transcription elongation factor Spt4